MGYHNSWSVETVVQQIRAAAFYCSDGRNDGYTAWYAKQDLYQIKEILDAAISKCPNFAGEEQWLKEREQKKIIKILKDD